MSGLHRCDPASHVRRVARLLSTVVAVLVLATACMSKVRSDEPSNAAAAPSPVTVTIPPERLTPF